MGTVEKIYPKLKKIENEIKSLKIMIIKSQKIPKKVVRLEGLLKGVKIDENEIEETKKFLFKFSD